MDQSAFIIAVSFSTIGYVFFMTISSSEKIRACLFSENKSNVLHIVFQRSIGLIIFGIIPFFGILSFSGFKYFTLSLSKETLLLVLALTLIILPVTYFSSRTPDNLAQYPQIRKESWSAGLIAVSALSWIMYLFAYEMLFRGFLLFSSIEIMGHWPAIILNTGIYSLVHYPKGKKEAFGAVPFGLILCILSIRTGTFMVAFLAHVVLALSSEWFSLYAKSLLKKSD